MGEPPFERNRCNCTALRKASRRLSQFYDSALAPSGQPVWREIAVRSARAVTALDKRGIKMRDILTPAAIRNAMTVHAAFGGSTNLLLHIPAIAHSAGIPRPAVADAGNIPSSGAGAPAGRVDGT